MILLSPRSDHLLVLSFLNKPCRNARIEDAVKNIKEIDKSAEKVYKGDIEEKRKEIRDRQ